MKYLFVMGQTVGEFHIPPNSDGTYIHVSAWIVQFCFILKTLLYCNNRLKFANFFKKDIRVFFVEKLEFGIPWL